MIKIVQVLSCFLLFGIVSNEKFQCSLISTRIGKEKDDLSPCSLVQYRRPYTTKDKIIATKTQKGVVSSGTYNMELINQKQRESAQQPVININLPLYIYGGQNNQQQFNSAYYIPEISSIPANIGFYPWSSPTPTKFETGFIPKSHSELPWVHQQTISATTIPSPQIIKNQTQISTSISIPLPISQILNPIPLPLPLINPIPSTSTSEIISTTTTTTNNENITQLSPIVFPPPSLNFSVIPNLTNINTPANTSSFSYTAPLNLSTTLSSQNINSSIVRTSAGYSNLSQIINPNADFTFVSVNSSLINPPFSSTPPLPNMSSFSTSSSVNSPAVIPYTSINDFSAQLLNLSPTPSQYTPKQEIISTPLLGIGQNVNLSGFLNATDLAILGCDQYGNC